MTAFKRAALLAGFGFLYLPIALLIIFSFNASPAVTVWTGFSSHWYGELLANAPLRAAAWLSLLVALAAASLAAFFGTLAALALARFGRLRLRWLFVALVITPLVMPEVVSALALLLWFVTLDDWIGWPDGRGFITLVLGHASFGVAYVAVIVQARLRLLDGAIEDAAADLGAPPARVFTAITLPQAWPAIAAGWLLVFVLSLDDLVIASFLSGPGTTTLPIYVFGSVRRGVSPQINALGTLLVVVAATFITIGWAAWRRGAGSERV